MSSQPGARAMIDVVIPTLNAVCGLAPLLEALAEARAVGLVGTVVVSDGGSRDDTLAVARAGGAMVVAGPPGRGVQLAAGARVTTARWLLFIHADTLPGPGWQAATRAFVSDPANEARAGVFGLRLDDEGAAARRVERLAALRGRILGLPYGDQGLLISRGLYERLGGFRPMALMEDVDMIRRIGRGRLCHLPADFITSAARYRRDGWWARPLRNLGCLALYFAGVPPRTIARLYQ